MATEETRLLKKSFDYLSNSRLTVDPKSRECVVVVPAIQSNNNCNDEIVGLTLEELTLYLDDPWWKLLRRSILISFWVLLFAIFASACIISVVEYKEICTINSMKSSFSANNLARINYTLSTNAMASNSTVTAIIKNNTSTMK